MANKYVQYGDKRFEVESSMALEQIKAVMARHFPELADPRVETKKEGDDVTYTFTKQAGRKGAGLTNLQKVARNLGKVKETPVVPVPVLALMDGEDTSLTDYQVAAMIAGLKAEAERVGQIGRVLLDLPPACAPSGGVL